MKVLFLPNNTASLASSRTGLLRKKGIEAIAFNFAPTVNQTKDDVICLPRPQFSISFFFSAISFLRIFFYHLFTADVVHWIYGSKSSIATAVLYLVAFLKRKKFIEYCGSDVRSLEKMCQDAGYDLSTFSDSSRKFLGTEETSLMTQKKFKSLGFFSLPNSPELVDYIEPAINPKFTEIFRTVDLNKLQYAGVDPNVKKPLVVHMPSNPQIKGTSKFIEATQVLEKEGLIEVKMITGMAHAEALKVLQSADIVVDQLLIGEYGVLTIEALALGKPVVCYLRPKLSDYYSKLDHFSVQNAPGNDLEKVLRELVANPAKRVELGKEGRKYVEKFHNPEVLADKLISIYRS